MKKRSLVLIGMAVLTSVAFGQTERPAVVNSSKPNIVFLLSDDQPLRARNEEYKKQHDQTASR